MQGTGRSLTRSNSGIGRATAIAFARSGIQRLTLTDINEANLAKVSKSIKDEYPNVEIQSLVVNVRDTDAVNSTISKTVERFGRIDIAVNVAGSMSFPNF